MLYVKCREQAGREANPTAAVIDRWGVAARRHRLMVGERTLAVASTQLSMHRRRYDMSHYAGLDVSVAQVLAT